VVVAIRDAALGAANATVDAVYAARDAAQAALDFTLCPVDSACDERDEMMAAYQDEELCLESLQSDLDFHTHRLRDTEP